MLKRTHEILDKLQNILEHENPDLVFGRKTAIRRLLETHVEHLRYFGDDKVEYLISVFESDKCWSGARLKNSALGKRLTKKRLGNRVNPFRRYDMACRYCVISKIPALFEKQFKTYKVGFNFNAIPHPVTDAFIRNSLLKRMKKEDPLLSFWMNKETGELKRPKSAAEGFDYAMKLNWTEGLEYFYNQLEKNDRKNKLTESIVALSDLKATKKDAQILDFCVRKIGNKDSLLKKLLQEDEAVYALFTALINSYFLDTVDDLIKDWCCKEASDKKIFTQREYELVLSSLSLAMLNNPESSAQARSVIMRIWNCSSLNKYRKEAVVNSSNDTMPLTGLLASLIINWERTNRNCVEKKEIMKLMLFAKNSFPVRFKYVKEKIMKNLSSIGRRVKKNRVDYCKSAEEIFFELERPPVSMDLAIAIVEGRDYDEIDCLCNSSTVS